MSKPQQRVALNIDHLAHVSFLADSCTEGRNSHDPMGKKETLLYTIGTVGGSIVKRGVKMLQRIVKLKELIKPHARAKYLVPLEELQEKYIAALD